MKATSQVRRGPANSWVWRHPVKQDRIPPLLYDRYEPISQVAVPIRAGDPGQLVASVVLAGHTQPGGQR